MCVVDSDCLLLLCEDVARFLLYLTWILFANYWDGVMVFSSSSPLGSVQGYKHTRYRPHTHHTSLRTITHSLSLLHPF